MKKVLLLLLALVMTASLWGCKSKAAENAQTLIEAIGTVTTDSAAAISAAEEACSVLTEEEKADVENYDSLRTARIDYAEAVIAALGEITAESESAVTAAEEVYGALSDAEKASVENREVLSAARTALEEALFEKFRLSFTGEWSRLTAGDEAFITLNADGTGTIIEYDAQWSLSPEGTSLMIQGAGVRFDFAVSSIGGSHAIYCEELGTMLVKKDAYPEIAEQYFVIEQVSDENISDYVGEIVHIRNIPDEQGAESNLNVFAFRSSAYDNGLVFVGAGDDFSLEYSYIINVKRSLEHVGKLTSPYLSMEEQTADASGIAIKSATGTLFFVKSELVADLTYDSASHTRVITLTDGVVLYDRCMVSRTGYRAYDYLSETDLSF